MSNDLNAERMKHVLHFIERNLDEDIDCNQMAEIAFYSRFHFHRLFQAYAGESVYAFRKRLLLERAVKHLQFTRDSISDIAYKCGYENQASFNKAFRKQFLMSPSDVRKQMISINRPMDCPLPERIEIMTPEIVELNDVPVISARGSGEYSSAASEAWGKLMGFAYKNRLMNKEVRLFGVSYDDPDMTDPERIRYDACLDIDTDVSSDVDVRKQVISGGKYAKFLHKGAHENFAATYTYIFKEWLPNSGYQLRDVPCFDIYLNRDPRRTKPENLRTEIYIPIV
ncbi:AraC family transcriptional regulator [Enterovibrio sp. ZSDZ35]|uniref:AraC family transcriptional regulator n=1 Tax=Enterovibrio qingdaonensis TaxID=2899818 RepID=A0ABT5QNJ4_9GAMM|nr:AraC family transcriptional regulator [Enterovibrio sp. ZSDZ35]MDD1782556.1 AraC family transcriptional regulator [Enterovibrio sp. ZSDZ35]